MTGRIWISALVVLSLHGPAIVVARLPAAVAVGRCAPRALAEALPAEVGAAPELSGDLAALVAEARRRGMLRSAALLVLRRGRVVVRAAFGGAREDSIFDVASLTKVVATLPVVMQLVEERRLSLEDPVGRYLPWLAGTPLASIRLRELITHTSGLPSVVWAGEKPEGPERRLSDEWPALRERIRVAAGRLGRRGRYRYSDLGYLLLGRIIEAVTGGSLAQQVAARLTRPLGMCSTGFRLPRERRARAIDPWPEGHNLGVVYDPLAARMKGIAGHAGLYSTIDDLGRFAAMLLQGGVLDGRRVLAEHTVQAMLRSRPTLGSTREALGWRVGLPQDAASQADVGETSVYHLGFTGTSLWLDSRAQTAVVLLTDRTSIQPLPSLAWLRRSLHRVVRSSRLSLSATSSAPLPVQQGIDRLAASGFAELRGRRVALLANGASRDSHGRQVAELLLRAPEVSLVSLLAPEHGLGVRQEGTVADGRYTAAGRSVPVFSLYGKRRRPDDRALSGADTLVIDLPLVGVRYYTYIATMGWAIEEAARRGLRVIVLDRADPLGGAVVEGPVAAANPPTPTSYFPLPVRYGMTAGELARMFVGERKLDVVLDVVTVRHWKRAMRFDRYGKRWFPPSPNLRSWRQALLYAAVGLLESTNLAVGRGTDSPFVWFGAPWADGVHLAAWLERQRLPGVIFVPATQTPRAGPYRGKPCRGVRLLLTDLDHFQPVLTGLTLMRALLRWHPRRWKTDRLGRMLRDQRTVNAVLAQQIPVAAIARTWQPALRRFEALRRRYELYR